MGRLYTAMHQDILDVFNEHGVQIMTPAYEGDPEVPKVVPKEQWYQAPDTDQRAAKAWNCATVLNSRTALSDEGVHPGNALQSRLVQRSAHPRQNAIRPSS
jgi:hypothetical protein